MLRWVTDYCFFKFDDTRNYVLFIDDDYYLDVNSLIKYLKSLDNNDKMTTYQR